MKALPFSVNHVLDPRLYLGFDMVTEKYKLLHIFMETNPRRVIKHRILTLGTNFWRTIITPRNWFMSPMRHIYLHGFLYAIDTPAYFNFRQEEFGNLPFIQHTQLRLNIMQTALWGKLIVRRSSNSRGACEYANMIYDMTLTRFLRNLWIILIQRKLPCLKQRGFTG